MAQKEFTQIYPQPGWVEHNPLEIWSSQLSVAVEAMGKIGVDASQIATIGITNQRETTIVWDKKTGKPVCNAIVWQCRRTAEMINELEKKGFDKIIKEKTGLIPDAYFSGTKLKWILEHVDGARERAEAGELLFGTVDTWLIWNLTKGKVFVTDYTNASRTMLFDIHKRQWDDEILSELNIPKCMLPEVKPSSCIYGVTDEAVIGGEIPISGAAGDQQAALFGQSVREMTRLVRMMGGNGDLAGGIPGAGDLFVTIFGGRTRRLGYLLGMGRTYAGAKEELKGVTLESVVIITRMSRAIRALSAQGKVDAKDYALILFLDSVINNGAAAEIPWDDFR